jgi:hypothetical protein
MVDIDKTISEGLDFADDSFESREENESTRTERQKLDMTSPFKLPQLIRPISFIWAMANETILTWATIFVAFFAKDVDPNAANTLMAALAANTAILTTITGFYFNSRKAEKIVAKKAEATLQIEKMKVRESKREARHQRKMEKRAKKKESV